VTFSSKLIVLCRRASSSDNFGVKGNAPKTDSWFSTGRAGDETIVATSRCNRRAHLITPRPFRCVFPSPVEALIRDAAPRRAQTTTAARLSFQFNGAGRCAVARSSLSYGY
jgi:hypothetical protein